MELSCNEGEDSEVDAYESNQGAQKSRKLGEIKDLAQVEGVDQDSIKILYKNGFRTCESILLIKSEDLFALLGSEQASRVISFIRKFYHIELLTGGEVSESRKNMPKLTTGSKNLDDLLGGGLEGGSITEVYGESGTGKTQFAHQICVTVQLPLNNKGLNGNAIFIDTEGTFRPERILQIAQRYPKLGDVNVLKNVITHYPKNIRQQMASIQLAREIIEEKKVRVIVIDTLGNHFRRERERSKLAPKKARGKDQAKIGTFIYDLWQVAVDFNLPILITNQVFTHIPESNPIKPPMMQERDHIKPIGGNVVAHVTHVVMKFEKSKEGHPNFSDTKIAKLKHHPGLPPGQMKFRITQHGIEDIPETDKNRTDK